MAKYSKRRSRRGSKRKRRGGNAVASMKEGVRSVGEGLKHGEDAVRKVGAAATGFGSDLTGAAGTVRDKIIGTTDEGLNIATKGLSSVASDAEQGFASAKKDVKGLGESAGFSGGRGRGGSGRCCFPAKFCGSRKRKGNKRRSIRTGRCCLPVKSKKCGAKKKNGRKTKKNKRKRKRGVFNMFGGG